MEDKQYISTTEAAQELGISRVTVFNRIKSGQIPAKKVGRNYIIEKKVVLGGNNAELTEAEKAVIDKAVDKTVREYDETLKLLADA